MTSTPCTVGDSGWRSQAACRDADPELFFPAGRDAASADAAAEICQTCPVIDACLRHAIVHREQHGIWGGLTPFERRPLYRLAALRLPVLPPDPDGTGDLDRRFATWAARHTSGATSDELRRSA